LNIPKKITQKLVSTNFDHPNFSEKVVLFFSPQEGCRWPGADIVTAEEILAREKIARPEPH